MDWEAEGLLEDLSGKERDARVGLLELLISEGFGLEDIKRSHGEGELMFLLTGRAIDVRTQYTWEQLVERVGMPPEFVERLIRAQGLARAEPGEVIYGDADVDMLKASAQFLEAGVPEDDMLAVGRLLGRGFSQAAEVMRGTALRMVLEPGLDEAELAERYAVAAGALTPMMEPLLGTLRRLPLSKMFQTEIITAEGRGAGPLPSPRHVTVAFA